MTIAVLSCVECTVRRASVNTAGTWRTEHWIQDTEAHASLGRSCGHVNPLKGSKTLLPLVHIRTFRNPPSTRNLKGTKFQAQGNEDSISCNRKHWNSLLSPPAWWSWCPGATVKIKSHPGCSPLNWNRLFLGLLSPDVHVPAGEWRSYRFGRPAWVGPSSWLASAGSVQLRDFCLLLICTPQFQGCFRQQP